MCNGVGGTANGTAAGLTNGTSALSTSNLSTGVAAADRAVAPVATDAASQELARFIAELTAARAANSG